MWPPPLFFPVPVTKFVVMSLATAGLYELYWLYRNWCLVRDRERTDIWPFWRAFFGYFFIYPLLARIYDQQPRSRTPVLLAVGWIGLNLLWRLPDPYWFVSFLSLFLLLPAQLVANRRNAKAAPDHDRNERFTPWNWVAVVLGVAFWGLAIAGMLLPDNPAS